MSTNSLDIGYYGTYVLPLACCPKFSGRQRFSQSCSGSEDLIIYFETKISVYSIYFPSKNGNLKVLSSENQQMLKVVKFERSPFALNSRYFIFTFKGSLKGSQKTGFNGLSQNMWLIHFQRAPSAKYLISGISLPLQFEQDSIGMPISTLATE